MTKTVLITGASRYIGALAAVEALAALPKGARVVLMRLGVVLGRGGGAMAQMLPAFKAFVGGPIGDGRQGFSWIALDDAIYAIHHLIRNDGVGFLFIPVSLDIVYFYFCVHNLFLGVGYRVKATEQLMSPRTPM